MKRTRKRLAATVWAHCSEDNDARAHDLAAQDPRWQNKDDQLHLLSDARKKLFNKLPLEEREHWEAEAKASKTAEMSE